MKYRKFLCWRLYVKKVLEELNQKIFFLYWSNNFMFVDNNSISNIHLFDDGLHLAESGRCILGNVIDRLTFLSKHIHHPNIHLYTMQ